MAGPAVSGCALPTLSLKLGELVSEWGCRASGLAQQGV